MSRKRKLSPIQEEIEERLEEERNSTRKKFRYEIEEKIKTTREKLVGDVYMAIIKECLRKCKTYEQFNKYRFISKLFYDCVKRYERKYLMFVIEKNMYSKWKREIKIILYNKLAIGEYSKLHERHFDYEMQEINNFVKKEECEK